MPGPPPPPPPINSAPAPSAGGEQGRNLLLESIRAGKSLKKTVTVDKSAPAIGGRAKEPTNGRNPPQTPLANNKPSNNGSGMALGGLFAGGMPRLKPIGSRGSTVDSVNTSTNTVKRGPPPAPPPSTQKPQILPPQVVELPNNTTEEPRGYGKSTPLPKTPITSTASLQRPSPPPKKLNLSPGTNVSRAQSMRLSRSPPVFAPTPSSLHQSQDCLNENQTRPTSTRVLRPPVVRPPSPPTSKPSANSNITRVAPPPPVRGTVIPPVTPPPPPPATHRTLPHQRLAPPPPPTPPTRCSSTQNGQTSNFTTDIESRFGKYFHPVSNFPPPDVYHGFPKVYNSKNAPKQQAPPPPPSQSSHNPNSMLPLNMSSTQGKQWHTSLAC